MGRPRIKDVAEYAGVSAKTVSNVLNDYEHVSERTRTAVREAIDALGYRVNIAGRQLRRGRTGVIALAVPELDIAYFAELAKHVMAEAERRGCTTLLLETGGRREKELAAVQGFDALLTDGVI
ncbi:LacI family DNA-binding transcriptional regulator, partial [Streptomyces werraensis]|uniref:LacI family DNA-binding transcriptional regulator n=1 Tax=Streptomyces werraensis TaxID=68284 RepID=UPI0034375E06